jgi:hypothetical protein
MGSSRTRDKRCEIRSHHVRPDAAAGFSGTPAPDGPTRDVLVGARRGQHSAPTRFGRTSRR